MSNATNVTFTVTVDTVTQSPKLTCTYQGKGNFSLICTNKTLFSLLADGTTTTANIENSGVSLDGENYLYSFNLPNEVQNVLSNYLTPNVVAYQDSFNLKGTKTFQVTNYTFELIPIVTINGNAILSFDEGFSLYSFPEGTDPDIIRSIKFALSDDYPNTLSLPSNNPLTPIVSSLKAAIQSGVTSASSIIDMITSIKVNNSFINPEKVLTNYSVHVLPFGSLLSNYSLSDAPLCQVPNPSYTCGSFKISPLTGSYQMFGTGITDNSGLMFGASAVTGVPPQQCNPLNGSGNDDAAKLSQPGYAQYSAYVQSLGSKSSVIYPVGETVATLGDFWCGVFSSINSNYTKSTPTILPSAAAGIEPTDLGTLFNPAGGSGYTPGKEGQNTSQSSWNTAYGIGANTNGITPFFFPYYQQLDPFVLLDFQQVNSADPSFTVCSKVGGVVLLNQGNTGNHVCWNIPGNSQSCMRSLLSQFSSELFTNQFSAMNIKFNYSDATAVDDDGNPVAGVMSYYPLPLSNFFSITNVSASQVSYHLLNLEIDDLPSIKEIEEVESDPFEVIANKILSMRDEFNAKVLNDINCKVMNFPVISDAISTYPSVLTYFSSNQKSKTPATPILYAALAPIFIGALNLGTYYSVVEDSYNLGPFKSIPSSFLLAGENTTSTNKWDQEFPWSPQQLSMLINGLYLMPSPTSAKAKATAKQTYTLNDSYHIFTTSTKPVTRYLPKHELTMLATDSVAFDPSINEIKSVMTALEDMATCMMAASTGYTVAKSSETMLNSLLKRSGVGSLEELSTSNDPSIQSVYSKLTQGGTNIFHAKSDSVSSQHDDYDSKFFIPKSDVHKKLLDNHMHNLHSIFDAVSLSTFKNSDILGQVNQYATNTFTKHKMCVMTAFGKLGTDMLADDALKLIDHAAEDVVKDSINIAVDIGKVLCNLAADIFMTASDLLNPVSVVSQLYENITEHIFNAFSQVPDVNSELYSDTATPGKAGALSLASIPNMFSLTKDGDVTANGDLSSNPFTLTSGGLVNSEYEWLNNPVVKREDGPSVSFPYNAYVGQSTIGSNVIDVLKVRGSRLSSLVPVRYNGHTSVGDCYVYVINGIQLNSNSGHGLPSKSLSDIIISPVPVKNHLGVIDPLRTYKKFIEMIYQLPRLFGCSGLFDYLYYKDLWTSFISKVGSQAGINENEHVAVAEIAAADSAGMGMALGFTARAVSDGCSFNGTEMAADGAVAITDMTDVGLYTNKVDQINSEPTILNPQYNTIINEFISLVFRFIIDWKYAMSGYLSPFLNKHKTTFPMNLIDQYNQYCSMNLTENEKNRHLVTILNDSFYGSMQASDTEGGISTIPYSSDFTYIVPGLGSYIDLDLNSRFLDEQVAHLITNKNGTYDIMTPVYHPSIVKDFMYVTAGLGRIISGAWLEKKTAQLFLAHAKLSKKIAYIRAKVKKVTNIPDKLAKGLNKEAGAKYHRKHNSKARAKLINAQTGTLESTLTQQTNTLAGDISGIDTGVSSLTFGFH